MAKENKKNVVDESTGKEIQELQFLEQNLQNLLMQKQIIQMELVDSENALEELGKTKGEVFKIVGSLMIKADKTEIEKELKKKKELLELRMKSIEKQENSFKENSTKLRTELLKKLK